MFPICLLPTARLRSRRKNDTASAPGSFFINIVPASKLMVFTCVAPSSGAVAILDFKKWRSHYRTKEKVGGQT